MQSPIVRDQRSTRSNPCPVCAGYDEATRGGGTRCYGFLSHDGLTAFCTREEFAGGLTFIQSVNAYPHALSGNCRCGKLHGSEDHLQEVLTDYPSRPASDERFLTCTPPYPADYLGADGAMLYRIGRWDKHNGEKRYAYFHPASEGWRSGRGEAPWVLYRLPEIQSALKA